MNFGDKKKPKKPTNTQSEKSPEAVSFAALYDASMANVTEGSIVKGTVAFPLIFHTLGGIRHLRWEWGTRGLESLVALDRSTMIMWAATALLTLVAMFVSVERRPQPPLLEEQMVD